MEEVVKRFVVVVSFIAVEDGGVEGGDGVGGGEEDEGDRG